MLLQMPIGAKRCYVRAPAYLSPGQTARQGYIIPFRKHIIIISLSPSYLSLPKKGNPNPSRIAAHRRRSRPSRKGNENVYLVPSSSSIHSGPPGRLLKAQREIHGSFSHHDDRTRDVSGKLPINAIQKREWRLGAPGECASGPEDERRKHRIGCRARR